MNQQEIIVFTDGSCIGNGKKYASGGIGIHFPQHQLKDISKVYRLGTCTNQKCELYAILMAIKYIRATVGLHNKHVIIKTDSKYSINCITKWIDRWIKNGWKTQNGTPVINREFIEPIYYFYHKYNITFHHVNSHTGKNDEDSIGNDHADILALKAAKRYLSEKKNQIQDIQVELLDVKQ